MMKIEGFMSKTIATALAGMALHDPHVHAPEEQLSDALKEKAAARINGGQQPTGRIVEICTGPSNGNKPDTANDLVLATLKAYTSAYPLPFQRVWAEGTAEESGTAGHFRVKDKDGEVVLQGDIGAGELTFGNTVIVATGIVVISWPPLA